MIAIVVTLMVMSEDTDEHEDGTHACGPVMLMTTGIRGSDVDGDDYDVAVDIDSHADGPDHDDDSDECNH